MYRWNWRGTIWLERRFLLFLFMLGAAQSRIFDKCTLARRLLHRHHLAWDQVQTWVCIARLQSNLNTATVNYDAQGIGYHGMYQISDRYWCGPGNVCNLNCDRLLDDDLSDDLACIAHIFAEHERISGNGYTAWTVYERSCAPDRVPSMDECFEDATTVSSKAVSIMPKVNVQNKVYDRCELARELKFVHGLPSDQISTWVCIAKHESNFHTSAVGRLNADGSADHGLFQISDIYWCSPNGWACDVTCELMRDSNITDDVQCIKTIHAEHQRLSGDGFNAWAVYHPHCRHKSAQYIEGCFENGELEKTVQLDVDRKTIPKASVNGKGKVYTRCELAEELRDRHHIPEEQIATWVCIAHHESRYNTSAVGRLNADGSGDHGLFQISDIYWCSPPGNGWVCGISCDDLEDDDISDDVKCMQTIYEEHLRLSGDGFNAWAVYQPYCRGRSQSYLDGCFTNGVNSIDFDGHSVKTIASVKNSQGTSSKKPTGKVYERCELAKELRFKHGLPLEQIATWVCIAKHESLYNTAAVGRLNSDGSADHGLFQISDIYWCSPPGKGWACGVSCSDLEDSDITDDVKCIRTIHAEHNRLSGDGFRAWAVYEPYCRGQSTHYTDGCFDEQTVHLDNEIVEKLTESKKASVKKATGKVFERCELALELHRKHQIPLDEVSTWVCIAEHESHFNTSAVGRLNGDESADHGIFQISDIYWCSPPGRGWACGLSCADLEDDDISDDVRCLRTIYEEHQRLSGDGFNAWAVYPVHCKGRSSRYTEDCFKYEHKVIHLNNKTNEVTTENQISTPFSKPTTHPKTTLWQQHTASVNPTSKTELKFTLSNQGHIRKTTPLMSYARPSNVFAIASSTTSNVPITTNRQTTTIRPKTTIRSTTTTRPLTKLNISTTNRPSVTKKPSSFSQSNVTTKKTTTKTLPTKVKTTQPPKIKLLTSTENTFSLYLNGFSTKAPTTFYSFSTTAKTATTALKPDAERSKMKNTNFNTEKLDNKLAQKIVVRTTPTLKPIHVFSSTRNPPTSTERYHHPYPKLQSSTTNIAPQMSWPTKSSSKHNTSILHSIVVPIQTHSSEVPTPTTTQLPSLNLKRASSTKPTANTRVPFTLESHIRSSHMTTTTTKLTPSTRRPSVDASAQTILDMQATTKTAFDKLFDLFHH